MLLCTGTARALSSTLVAVATLRCAAVSLLVPARASFVFTPACSACNLNLDGPSLLFFPAFSFGPSYKALAW